VAAWRQEGAGHTDGKGVLCAGQALCLPRVRFTLNSTVHLRSKILRRIRSGLCTGKFQITAAPAATANASEASRRAHSCHAARQTCWREQLASPVLRTCLITTTRYGKSRNPPPPSSQHGCSWCGCRGIAKHARTVALSRRLS
jgi:hypothetical protein